MAYTSTAFPAELVKDVFLLAKGKSSIARLSEQTPIAFSGTDIMTFSLDGEVNLVGEGAAKAQHTGANNVIHMKPLKLEYGQRVSDEFIRCSDEKQLEYLRAFEEGFARKIARGLDIMVMHGTNPKTGTAAALIGTNSLDTNTNVTAITYTAADPEANITAGVAAIGEYDLNGIAMDKTFSAALAGLKSNNLPVYPQLQWGGQPESINGVPTSINSTVSVVTGKHAYMGDFQNAFRWGYAESIPIEIIPYGDPDNSGNDLKGYNQVYLRAEAWIGWAILDGSAFARIEA